MVTPAQTITISPDGNLSGLVHKPGKGVNITKLGKASVVRASEVVWDEQKQKWNVRFLKGNHANDFMTVGQCLTAHDSETEDAKSIAYFTEYDDGVKAEIAYFNQQRLNGELTEMDKSL